MQRWSYTLICLVRPISDEWWRPMTKKFKAEIDHFVMYVDALNTFKRNFDVSWCSSWVFNLFPAIQDANFQGTEIRKTRPDFDSLKESCALPTVKRNFYQPSLLSFNENWRKKQRRISARKLILQKIKIRKIKPMLALLNQYRKFFRLIHK